MNKVNDDWRGSFGSIRTPFEYKSILLGFVGVSLFLGGVWLFDLAAKGLKPEKKGDEGVEEYQGRLSKELDYDETIFERFLKNQLPEKSRDNLRIALGNTYKPDTGYLSFSGPLAFWFSFRAAPWWLQLPVFLWFVAIWALIGGAITRVTAMRVAKDESISFKEAGQYVWNNKLSYLLTPLAVVAFMIVFVLCNMLAGVVGMIPFVGPFLYVLLYVLVLLSTLFLILLGIGLVFGFHMISSSISTEGGDGLQAVINVFNYVYARPWQYILYTGLVGVSVVFIWWVGNLFVDLSLETTFADSEARSYLYVYEKKDDADPTMVEVTPEDGDPRIFYLQESKKDEARKQWAEQYEKLKKELEELKKDEKLNKERIEDKEKEIEKHDEKEPKMFSADLSLVGDYIAGTPVRTEVKKTDERTLKLSDIPSTPIKVAAAVLFFVVGALKLLVLGYAASYVLAGFTTMYFILRRDVDGTDFEEIVEKEESVEFGEEVFEEKKAEPKAEGQPAPAPAPPPAPAAPPAPETKPAEGEAKEGDETKT